MANGEGQIHNEVWQEKVTPRPKQKNEIKGRRTQCSSWAVTRAQDDVSD